MRRSLIPVLEGSMKKLLPMILVLTLALALPAAPAGAGWFSGLALETANLAPGDHEDLTVGVAAVSLAAAKLKPASGIYKGRDAQAVMLSVETADLRFRIDGGLPTAASGHFLVAGDYAVLHGGQALSRLRLIRTGDGDATVRVTYFY